MCCVDCTISNFLPQKGPKAKALVFCFKKSYTLDFTFNFWCENVGPQNTNITRLNFYFLVKFHRCSVFF
ncbi:hypothetical protein BGP_2943 [Beggiatoa sp. PS]|nr:hypothetical protein BGP_2943 [Beggiatoa sp. PS]